LTSESPLATGRGYFLATRWPCWLRPSSAFATLDVLTKNSFRRDQKSQYVVYGTGQRLSRTQSCLEHVFRQRDADRDRRGFPGSVYRVFRLADRLIIETIFTL